MGRLAASVVVSSVLAAVALGARAAGDEHTIKLTVASSQSTSLAWIGTMHTLVVPELNRRLEARGSPSRIRWTESYGGSLYKYPDTLEAIEIGLADMGWVGTLWELSKLPLQNVTYYAPFVSDDFRVAVDVLNELNRTVPAMQNAWAAQNVHFLGASALASVLVGRLMDARGRRPGLALGFAIGIVGLVK